MCVVGRHWRSGVWKILQTIDLAIHCFEGFVLGPGKLIEILPVRVQKVGNGLVTPNGGRPDFREDEVDDLGKQSRDGFLHIRPQTGNIHAGNF